VSSTTARVVRLARVEDAEEIARIYNQAIEERIATFETAAPSAEDIVASLHKKGDRFPTVVVEDEGRVVAFAWVSSYRERPCYSGVGEHSVYADARARRSGAGSAALRALFEESRAQGFWKLVSRIFVHNAPSRALHLKLGFREVGVYRRHAQLDGEWVDCVIVEKMLDEG
jgi:phosphinothricin acetyltransferase